MKGYPYALMAALLFGASTPFAKELLGHTNSILLAGLLYLGSGIGLSTLIGLRTLFHRRAPERLHLSISDWFWIIAGVVVGGVLAPMLLMAGLSRTNATAGSLLLNFEAAFTGTLAWLFFKENVTRPVVWGIGLITFAGLLLSYSDLGTLKFDWASPLIAGACLCWAIDNNLIRKVAQSDALKIAALRGLLAGSVNVTLASTLGTTWPATPFVLQSAALGFLSYGLGLAFFIVALRHLGAARAGANFAVAPFIGAAASVLFFGENLTRWILVSAVLMAFGLWLLIAEHPKLAK